MAGVISINAIIVLLCVHAWGSMFFGRNGDQKLSTTGLHSLKFYTVLSNLLSAVVALVYLSVSLTGTTPGTVLLALKLAAATSVMVTFLTTALFLGPTMGWRLVYSGPNFNLHLTLPLLAAIDVAFITPVGSLGSWAPFVATIPTVLYALWYVRRLLVYGAQKDGIVYDFYGFTRWGTDKIALLVAIMLAATLCVALVLWTISPS